MTATAEQLARDLLERLGVDAAQDMSAGDVIELANLIAALHGLRIVVQEVIDEWRGISPASESMCDQLAERLARNVTLYQFKDTKPGRTTVQLSGVSTSGQTGRANT